MFRVYTDGACRTNSGVGGVGIVFVSPVGLVVAEFSHRYESEERVTNNRMELLAAINAMRACPSSPLTIISDSQYLVKGVGRLPNWKKRGWTWKGGKLVANRDLWEQIDRLLASRGRRAKVVFEWVRGHSGNRFNERADALATEKAGTDSRGKSLEKTSFACSLTP